jgi:hypothetical protein
MTVQFGHEISSVIPYSCIANIWFGGDEIWIQNSKFTRGVPKIQNVHLAGDARSHFWNAVGEVQIS